MVRLLLRLLAWASVVLAPAAWAAPFDDAAIAQFIATHPKPMVVRSADRVKTNMLELAVNWYGLPKTDGTGGALVVAGDILIVVRPKGEVLWADVKRSEGFHKTKIEVPMKLAELKASGIVESSELNFRWFRVGGAYGEGTGKGFRLFVSHHVFENGCFYFQVSAIDLTFRPTSGLRQASDWKTIFKPSPCIHIGEASDKPFAGHQAGGRIVPLDDRYLLVSYGDHEIDGAMNRAVAPQDPASPYGKIWKIARDGSASSLYALGFRNPQGMLAARDGRIWESEHGPQGGDELNLIVERGNYGWPHQTLGIGYEDYVWMQNAIQGDHSDPRYRAPQFAWVPSIATSNLTQVTGTRFPLWQSDLLLATLAERSIHRLRIVGDRVLVDEPIKIGRRLRDIAFLADGRIALITDDALLAIIDNANVPLKASAPASGLNVPAK